MNKKLIFRILGALASALIIVAVFVPFVSIYGFSQSLWDTYKAIDTLYLPIMIIIFGVIGVIFFSLNIKTEFAYMSTGAIMFFVIMQTIDVIDQGVFNTLSIGYYFLVIGAVLTGVMAFLSNLRTRKVESVQPIDNSVNEPSMIDQIDKLYDNQVQNNVEPIQPVENVIPIQPISPIPAPEVEQVNIEPIAEPQKPIPEIVPEQHQVIQPQMASVQSIPTSVEPQIQNNQMVEPQQINPVIQQFNQPTQNPVLQEFEPIKKEEPMVQMNQPEIQPSNFGMPLSSVNEIPTENKVVQEFTNPQNPGLQINQSNNNTQTDIFGQPINK